MLFWSGRLATVLAGALMLLCPALYNGFPLLYPDSMTYLADGAPVARALFLHRYSSYYGVRSLLYSLVILPFHANRTVWPVAALQCLLAAWVLRLLVRLLVPGRSGGKYLALVLFLALFSSLGWYCGFIMPDVLGPLAYLCLFLLVFARERLSLGQRCSLWLIGGWGITAHATHLLLAGFLIVLLAFWTIGHLRRLRGLAEAVAVLALAAAAQIALHGYLYDKPSLNGERPPYLLARVIADGPGKLYLEQNCGHEDWAVCAQLDKVTDDPDHFLWDPEGAYAGATEEEQERICREEIPLVLAAVRAHPRLQFERSMENFRGQLTSFGLYGFDPSPWIEEQFATVLTPAHAAYLRSRQARTALPLDPLSDLQWWTVVISLETVVVLTALFRLRLSGPLWALSAATLLLVPANAAVTGILSVVDDRYGCRIIWMIPLLGGIFLFEAAGRITAARAARRGVPATGAVQLAAH